MTFDTTQSAYIALRDIVAERSDAIVAWVGAGLSMPAGLPGWGDLRRALVEETRRLAQTKTDLDVKNDLRRLADQANVDNDLWNAFGLLQEKLGSESYRAVIRHALKNAERVAVPQIYRRVWKLGVSGILNLNVDRLATRAFAEPGGSPLLHEFTGNDAGDFLHVLRSNVPWLANLHGILDNAASWVFTTTELRRLTRNPGYTTLISSCFATRTVVFLGITAGDDAAGGHLARLTSQGVDCGGHFWVTHRGAEHREWAEKSGIRIIQYDAANDHQELNELFDDLLSYKSVDLEPIPVSAIHVPQQSPGILPLNELLKQPTVKIRDQLNAYASQILAETTPASISQFESFANDYSEAIYRAWYVEEPSNIVLGYTLTEQRKEGAFGTVFRAIGPNGQQYAVKILHERVRKSREMLQSFRRGVRSMQILTANNLKGVVRYYDASEIPAMVVMDFIEGIDLSEAVKKNVLSDWKDVLNVAVELAQVIRHSHRLPQRVLHRDIRPSNVMLENCWGPSPRWDEVRLWVLDFDLSYHRDAFDVSITKTGESNGFLAPEQVRRDTGMSTRNAAVDSFGLGMTLYYLRTGVEPRFSEHLHAAWKRTLESAAGRFPCKTWMSLPYRYFRMVESATQDRQEHRLDVARLEDELIRMQEAVLKPFNVSSAEFLAEEIAARAFGERYEWDPSRLCATYRVGSIEVVLTASENSREVKCHFQWLRSGGEHHQDVKRWLPRARDKALSELRAGGWKADVVVNTGQLRGSASIVTEHARTMLEKCAQSVQIASIAISFSSNR